MPPKIPVTQPPSSGEVEPYALPGVAMLKKWLLRPPLRAALFR